MSDKIKMRDGDAILIMVKDGKVIHHSWNMSLPHSEFVKRAAGELPAGAWVGTASKIDGQVAAISSKHFLVINFPPRPRFLTLFAERLNDAFSFVGRCGERATRNLVWPTYHTDPLVILGLGFDKRHRVAENLGAVMVTVRRRPE